MTLAAGDRDVPAGAELHFPYVESPSKARMLLSFGFAAGIPDASLVASDLPPRDPAFLRRVGCDGPAR